LDEVAPRVKAICEKYGVNYNIGTPFEQITSVFKNGIKYAWLIK
ncbi:MAG: acyl-CoA desaturase, partial [Candidatus Sericytochromatia bacterium]|nr:acyl-CoA desaturase [Candidatus Sericytochromatia bacterium]